MGVEYHVYRLVGSLPVFVVLLVGIALCIKQHWRQPKVCTLVGMALLLTVGIRVVFPIVVQPMLALLWNSFGVDDVPTSLRILLPTFLYASASAVVWGLVLWAVFGDGGVVRSVADRDDHRDSPDLRPEIV